MKNVSTKISVLILSVAALSGCGTNGVSEKGATAQAQTNNLSPTPVPVNTGFVPMYRANTSAWGTWNLTTSSSANALTQSYASRSATPPIDADLNLSFRISPEAPSAIKFDQLNSIYTGLTSQFGDYSNFVAQYDCVRYRVYVQVESTPGNWVDKYPGGMITPYLKYGSNGCQGVTTNVATASVFNMTLTPGHGAVRILVANESDNFYCKIGYWNRCPTYPVYTTHVVNSIVEIQTDVGYGGQDGGWQLVQ